VFEIEAAYIRSPDDGQVRGIRAVPPEPENLRIVRLARQAADLDQDESATTATQLLLSPRLPAAGVKSQVERGAVYCPPLDVIQQILTEDSHPTVVQ